jgi:hypothetical protein
MKAKYIQYRAIRNGNYFLYGETIMQKIVRCNGLKYAYDIIAQRARPIPDDTDVIPIEYNRFKVYLRGFVCQLRDEAGLSKGNNSFVYEKKMRKVLREHNLLLSGIAL